MSKIQRENPSSCLFRLCPLASFCVPFGTFYVTLFWALFPPVKRFPSSLSPDCISILLWRGTKGRHCLHRLRTKILVSQDFEQCMFLAQPLPTFCMPTYACSLRLNCFLWGNQLVSHCSLFCSYFLCSAKSFPIHPFKFCRIIFCMMISYI